MGNNSTGTQSIRFPDGKRMTAVFPLVDDEWSPGSVNIILGQTIVADQYYVRGNLKKSDVVIDVGASIGGFSWFCSSLGAEVYSFEPNPAEFRALEQMIETNDVNSKAFRMAISDGEGMVSFFRGNRGALGEGCIRESSRLGDGIIMVQRTPLDFFVASKGISKVSLIKVDTEGHEMRVIAGAKETIEKHHPVIVMSEYHRPEDPKVLPEAILAIREDYQVHHMQKELEYSEPVLVMIPEHLSGEWALS